MALKDLTLGDFQFYKDYAHKMIDCHEREFMQKIEACAVSELGYMTKEAK